MSAPAETSAQAALNWSADDSLRIAMLTRDGVKAERTHAVVWAPRDSMTETWVAALADTLDRGVARLREIMRAPYAWQRIGDGPVTFYLSPGRFISHGTGYGAVFIPVSRVHERLAPFLHEASHELLAPHPPFYRDEFADSAEGRLAAEATPLWLFEGLPDYLAQTAAPRVGLHEGDVFEIGGLAKVDSTCTARVRASPHGQSIIDVMGRSARPAALFTTERAQVAPVFYACGQSLTKHIIERIGVRAAVELMPAIQRGTWERDLERAAGQSVDVLRQTWLERIGLEPHFGRASAASMEEVIASFARDHALEVRLSEGRLEGPTAEWIRREAAQAQFLFLGEEHDTREVPLIAGGIWRELIPLGYRHVAVEAGPWLGDRLDRFARFGDTQALEHFLRATSWLASRPRVGKSIACWRRSRSQKRREITKRGHSGRISRAF